MTRPQQHATTAAATLLVAAAACFPAAAQAGTVQLWACHGPGGEALGSAPLTPSAGRDGLTAITGRGCEGPAGSGTLTASFARADPSGGSAASWQLAVPAGVTLDSLRLARATSGFAGPALPGDPQSYQAQTSTASLETASLESAASDLAGELAIASTSGRYLRVGVSCALPGTENCPAPAAGTVGVQISSIALGVADTSSPTGALSGVRSPAAGSLSMLLGASDNGLGLANAEASLDERNPDLVRLGAGACPERPTPATPIEMPIEAPCPHSVTRIPLALNTTAYPDGPHRLRVTVTDAAGNTTTLVDEAITIDNSPTPPGTIATVTLGVGNQAPGGPEGSGGVLGTTSSGGTTPPGKAVACRQPKLTMALATKPLRRLAHGVPVLRARHPYRYRGRLTCLLNSRRVAAPTGTVVRVLFRIKGRTYRSGRGTMTVHDGNLTATFGYWSSRTIIFRYKPGDGEYTQVTSPIKVLPAPKPNRRHR